MARLLISFLLLLVGGSFAGAQERIIDEETYYREINSASQYRLKENYRERRTTIPTSGPMTLEIHEVEQPGPKMRVKVFRIDRNETEPTLETIFIGQKKYEKRPGLAWQVEERKGAPMVMRPDRPEQAPMVTRSDTPKQAPIGTASDAPKVEYKDLGIEPHGSMRVFQRIVRKQLTYDGATVESTQTHKSWIDSSGRLKKDEYKTTNPKSGSTVLTMEYEVDPTIRVEAPIK